MFLFRYIVLLLPRPDSVLIQTRPGPEQELAAGTVQNKTTFATKDWRLTKTIFKVQLEVFRTNCQKADMAMIFHVVSNVDLVFLTTWQNVRIIHFGHRGPQDMARNMVLLMYDSCIRITTDPGCLVTHQNVLGVLGIAPKPFATIVTP